MDAPSVEVIVSCEGEFYSEPPEDHVARYAWAIERMKAQPERYLIDAHLPVVDVGCGSGYGLAMLEEAGFRAMGIDRNLMAMEFCHSRNVQAWVGDYPCPLWVPSEQWLAVVLFEVIEHSRDGMAMLERAMKDAPWIFASVPENEAPGVNAFHQLHNLNEGSFAWMQPAPTFHRLKECPSSLLLEWRA